ncbi:MAG: glutaredoxin 3 [Alphaproteobacteria bacterium]|nr:glutaredoxin 3 [Alphaproteobacteria bacterium]
MSKTSNVVMYSSMMCPFCHRAKALLKDKGVEFEEISVDMKPDVRAEMREKSGGVNSVPQIFIGDVHVGGCDELYALENQGKLNALLEQAA